MPEAVVVTDPNAGAVGVLPELLGAALLVALGLDPNPGALDVALGALEPKFPAGADTLGVDG